MRYRGETKSPEEGGLIAKLKADTKAVPESLYLAADILAGLFGAFKLGFNKRLRKLNDAILAAARECLA